MPRSYRREAVAGPWRADSHGRAAGVFAGNDLWSACRAPRPHNELDEHYAYFLHSGPVGGHPGGPR
ncbi:MAG: hypothetical protein L0H64_11720 [Pseudonocardia sp.]|nr:hypothetical protein [Pseudonocardia sp.]